MVYDKNTVLYYLCIFSMELILHMYTYKVLYVVFEFVISIDVKWFTFHYINDRLVLLYLYIFSCIYVRWTKDPKTTKCNKRLNCCGVTQNKFDETDIAILPLLWVSSQTLISSQYRHACMIGSEKALMLQFCQHWPASTSRQAASV